MRYAILGLVVVFLAVRITFRIRKRRAAKEPEPPTSSPRRTRRSVLAAAFGDVGLVAGREIRERIRGRIFRVGTVVVLLIVGAAIIIPSLHHGTPGPTRQTVAIVGELDPATEQLVEHLATHDGDKVKFVDEPSLAATTKGLRAGRIDFVIVNGDRLVLREPASDSNSPADASLVNGVAQYLGVFQAYAAAGLTPSQANRVDESKPVPIEYLHHGAKGAAQTTSIIGIVLLFVMLNQYDTWILIGVMQEKSSRVVEVLLSTVRPIQLLGGKVLGIGLVALAQATVIVGFALIVAEVVGSDLLKGTAPLVLAAELLWLVLGYAFYCWVYAAGGSTAERQDQVQTLALPLSIPIIVGYVFAITVASSGSADLAFKILAYLPPTAPFCMPVLVGLHDVSWWQFVLSALISIAGTVATAIFAARIYARAVLRTGGRVKLRELFSRHG
ncbi:MAG: ABC transporter permease [Acidimicrobiales bacterium]